MLRAWLIAIIAVTTVTIQPYFAYAQATPQFEDAAITSEPEFPNPYQSVTVQVNSFSINLDARPITWYVNGTETQRGIGKKQISVKTGAIGSVTRVVATIDVNGITKINKVIELRPNSVDLLWEAVDSYVPPFYRGKALPSAEGALRVTAVAIGTNNKSNQIFTWLRNNIISQPESGFGRVALSLRNNILNESTDIGVRVVSPDGSYRAENRVVIARAKPFIRFELSRPGTGTVYAKAGRSIAVNFDQFLVTAEPFFFSSRSGKNGISFDWKANNQAVPDSSGGNTNALYLSNPREGSLELIAHALHDRFTLQEAKSPLTITFTP